MMSKIRAKNTKPELLLRSLLHRLGYRFRLHRKTLPGKPDIVMPKYNTVIFINGCFWHQHQGCKKATIPVSNHDKWEVKLNGNVQRDKENIRQLQLSGWKVFTIWECELKDKLKLEKSLKDFSELIK